MDSNSLQYFSNKLQNPFWKDVLVEWKTYKTNFEEDIDVRTYPIWDTYFLVHENLVQRKDELQAKNIHFVNDLLNETGSLMDFEEFKRRHNVAMNFMDFYSLIHSIPQPWRSALKTTNVKLKTEEIKQPAMTELLQMTRVCKGAYWKLIASTEIKRNHISKWSQDLNTTITSEDMSEYFSINFKCTVEVKMRSFQYKILHRVLPTNKFLKLCKIAEDVCYYCNNQSETLDHLFWHCPVIAKFWKDLANSLRPYIDLQSALCKASILLGLKSVKDDKILNHLINLTKRYIYTTKCTGSVLSIVGLIEKIKYTFKVEQNIVLNYNKNILVLENKWRPLMPLVAN